MALKALKPFDCEEANELVVRIAQKLYTQFSKNVVFLTQWPTSFVSHICHSAKPKKSTMLQLSGPWSS